MTGKYSRDTTLEVVRAYYMFLTTIPAIPISATLEAPVDGWPNVTTRSLSALKKNEVVIDLLRHLPIIEHRGSGNRSIAYDTFVLNYNGNMVHSCIDGNTTVGSIVPVGFDELPAHVAVLTTGGRYGSWLLLDIHEGK